MKRSTTNLVLATAAFLAASVAASAQTLKADIPFAFMAGGKAMPAGTYTLTGGEGQQRFVISNAGSHDAIILLTQGGRDPEKSWEGKDGVLQFLCGDGCVLDRVWTNTGYPAQKFAGRKAVPGARLALIRLSSEKH